MINANLGSPRGQNTILHNNNLLVAEYLSTKYSHIELSEIISFMEIYLLRRSRAGCHPKSLRLKEEQLKGGKSKEIKIFLKRSKQKKQL